MKIKDNPKNNINIVLEDEDNNVVAVKKNSSANGVNAIIKRDLKNLMGLVFSFVIAFFCIFDNSSNSQASILSKVMFVSLNLLFGKTKILLPILILIFVILNNANEEKENKYIFFLLLIIFSSFSLIITVFSLDCEVDSGLTGKILYYFSSFIFSDTQIVLFIFIPIIIYLIFTFIKLFRKSNIKGKRIQAVEFNFSKLIKKVFSSEQMKAIQDTFDAHSLDAEVVKETLGDNVDTYAIELGEQTRVKELRQLEDELKLSLKFDNLRIVSSNGKVYIEIAKSEQKTILLSKEFETIEFKESAKLSIPIGKNIANKTIYHDMKRSPHMLVSGGTGSGKSSFLHSIINSLLVKNSPRELNFILIDPKCTELNYSEVPHVIHEVKDDIDEIEKVLKFAVREMERRNNLLQQARVKNIEEYNRKSNKRLSYLLIVIEEYANLMIKDRGKVEKYVSRISQMGRTSGINLILVLQRTDKETLNGAISSNITNRFVFAVSEAGESRLVLGEKGAEKLAGNGDMLYKNSSIAIPMRLKGFYVPSKDTDNLISIVVNKYSNPMKNNSDDFLESQKNNEFQGSRRNNEFLEALEMKTTESSYNKKEDEVVEIKSETDEVLIDKIIKQSLIDKRISANYIKEKCSISPRRATRIYTKIKKYNIIEDTTSNLKKLTIENFDEWIKLKNQFN